MDSVMQRRLTRNLTLLKWLKIDELLLASAIVIAYELHVVGLSLTQVLMGEAIFAATILLFEIPTGVFSDLVHRKTALLFAEALLIAGVALLAFAQSFQDVILTQILWGIAVSTISGTDQALLYDSLLSLGREKEHRRIFGRIFSFSLVAIAIGQIISGVLGDIDLRLPLLLCIPIPIFKFVLIFFLQEPPRDSTGSALAPVLHMRSTLRYVFRHRTVLLLIFASMFIGLGWKTAAHTYNPFMELIDVPILYWGIILAAFNLLGAFLSRHAHTIIERMGEVISLLLIYSLYAIGFALLSSVHSPLAFLFFLLPWLINPIQKNFFAEELNKRAASGQRATVISIANFGVQGLQMVLLPVIGFTADLYGLRSMFLLFAVVLLVVGAFALLGLRRTLMVERITLETVEGKA